MTEKIHRHTKNETKKYIRSKSVLFSPKKQIKLACIVRGLLPEITNHTPAIAFSFSPLVASRIKILSTTLTHRFS